MRLGMMMKLLFSALAVLAMGNGLIVRATAQDAKAANLLDDPKKVILRFEIQFPDRIKPPKADALDQKAKADLAAQNKVDSNDGKTGDASKGGSRQGDEKKTDGKQGVDKTGGKKQSADADGKAGDGKSGEGKAGDGKAADTNKTGTNQGDSNNAINGTGKKADSSSQVPKPSTQTGSPGVNIKDALGGGLSNLTQDNPKQQDSKTLTLPSATDDQSNRMGIGGNQVEIPKNLGVDVNPQRRPFIEILADGTVNCGVIRQGAVAATSKLTEEQIQNLMRFIVDERKFFEIDEAKIASAMSEKELDTRNFSNYRLMVSYGGKERTINVTGVRSLARAFPELEPLQQAYKIDRRLNQLFVTVNVGGRQNMFEILKLVNEQLKKHNDLAPGFGVDDASFVAVSPDGNMRLTFGKSTYDEDGAEKFRYVATFRKVGNNYKVAIYGYGN